MGLQSSNKREARVFAFQFLYHLNFNQHYEQIAELRSQIEARGNHALNHATLDYSQSIDPLEDTKLKQHALEILAATITHMEEIQKIIQQHSKNWKLERISKVELTILQLGIGEILYGPGTPRKVVINEAIEMAKIYGGKDSGNFVNAILDKINIES